MACRFLMDGRREGARANSTIRNRSGVCCADSEVTKKPDTRPAHYLEFLSKLYKLAADFDQRQLMRIRETAAKEDNDIVASMAAALLRLRTPTKPVRVSSVPSRRHGDSGVDGLREVLLSRKIFPSNSKLLSLAHRYFGLPPKPKESRERLVGRILRGIEKGTVVQQESFRHALEQHIAKQNVGSDFVSRWTKVIRDLQPHTGCRETN